MQGVLDGGKEGERKEGERKKETERESLRIGCGLVWWCLWLVIAWATKSM